MRVPRIPCLVVTFSVALGIASAFPVSAEEETPVYSLISDLGSMYTQFGLTTYMDGVESWTAYSSSYTCSYKKSYGLSEQITGVTEACEITELYKYYDNSASPVFKAGTSYQLYLPLVKEVTSSGYTWLPMQNLYAPDCTVRAYIAPEIYMDFDAVCTDTIDGNVVYLTVSVPVLDQDYYALEVRLHHCASGCYINSQVMLYTAILESYNLYYYNYNLVGDYPRYRVLSETEQAEIFTPVGDTGGSSGSSIDLSETNGLLGEVKEGIQDIIGALESTPEQSTAVAERQEDIVSGSQVMDDYNALESSVITELSLYNPNDYYQYDGDSVIWFGHFWRFIEDMPFVMTFSSVGLMFAVLSYVIYGRK